MQQLKTIKRPGNVSLLQFFAARGDAARFEALLKIGCDPRQTSADGFTSLHVAAFFGHKKIIKLIIAHQKAVKSRSDSFKIDAKTNDGKTAWLLAKEKNDNSDERAEEYQKVLDLLRKEGAQELNGPLPSRKVWSKLRSFATKQYQFATELESTQTYQFLNDKRFLISLAAHVSAGVPAMLLQAIRLTALYAPSYASKGGNKLYYTAKPFLHNNTHWVVQEGFEKTSEAASLGLRGIMGAIRLVDYGTYPARHISGTTGSYLFANASTYFTNNKEYQGAAYFTGQILGQFLVDSFNFTPKEEGAFDYELNKSLTLWSSMMTKRTGENFAYATHGIAHLLDPFYQQIGSLERQALLNAHEILSTFESYKALQDVAASSKEMWQSDQTYVAQAKSLVNAGWELKSNFNYYSDMLMYNIEEWINNTLVPEGKARDYANWYLQRTQISLLAQKTTDAEKATEQAQAKVVESEEVYARCQEVESSLLQDPTTTEIEINIAQEKSNLAKIAVENAQNRVVVSQQYHSNLTEQLAILEEAAQILWAKTPKGIHEAAFKTAQEKVFEARIELEKAKIALEQLEKIEKNEANQNKITIAEEKIKETEEALKNQSDQLIFADKNITRVLTSLEKEKFEKDKVSNSKHLEEKIQEWKDKTNAIYLNQDLYLQAENEEFQAKSELILDEYEYKVAQQVYDENHKKIMAFEMIPDLTAKEIKEIVAKAEKGYNTFDLNYLISYFVEKGIIDRQDANNRISKF